LEIRENGISTLKRYPRGVQKNYEIFFGAREKFSFIKTRQLGGFSYFFSFITISKSSPNASAICRISFSEKLSRFIFCERFCDICPEALLFFGYGKKKKTAGKAALCL
jgi:predicted nucleotidyltransferase